MCPNCPITGKRSFHGPREAREEARFMGQTLRGRGLRPPHRPYLCEHCGYWHLTKRPRYVDQVSRAQRVALKQRRFL